MGIVFYQEVVEHLNRQYYLANVSAITNIQLVQKFFIFYLITTFNIIIQHRCFRSNIVYVILKTLALHTIKHYI